MPIILTALIEALIYLASIPLCGAFALSTEGGLRFGVGVSAFDLRRALRHARRCRPVRSRRGKNGANQAWQILRRLKGARMGLQGRLGLGDAAATALVCGALRSLSGARVTVDVTPVFSGDGLYLELQGMIRLKTGQIIRAIAINQIENIRRRIARWTDTRLKA
jgi:hypothetical protein